LEIFLNLTIAFWILLTMLSVAINEASFLKFKLIKNYLRSTMTQTRLFSNYINWKRTISII